MKEFFLGAGLMFFACLFWMAGVVYDLGARAVTTGQYECRLVEQYSQETEWECKLAEKWAREGEQ